MPRYFVNKNAQSNGDHEVHNEYCGRCPNPENRIPLGWHATCVTAVAQAKFHYVTANGCYYCSNMCHTM